MLLFSTRYLCIFDAVSPSPLDEEHHDEDADGDCVEAPAEEEDESGPPVEGGVVDEVVHGLYQLVGGAGHGHESLRPRHLVRSHHGDEQHSDADEAGLVQEASGQAVVQAIYVGQA